MNQCIAVSRPPSAYTCNCMIDTHVAHMPSVALASQHDWLTCYTYCAPHTVVSSLVCSEQICSRQKLGFTHVVMPSSMLGNAAQVKPFILRRTKDKVLSDLPPKILQDVYIDPSALQRLLYQDFASSDASHQVQGALKAEALTEAVADKAPHVFQVSLTAATSISCHALNSSWLTGLKVDMLFYTCSAPASWGKGNGSCTCHHQQHKTTKRCPRCTVKQHYQLDSSSELATSPM